MTVNLQAIEAAAEAMHEAGWTCEAHEPLGLNKCDQCADSTPKVVQKILTAAMPHIRKQIAEEIRNAAPLFSQATEDGRKVRNTLAYAANIVEGKA